VLHYAQTLFEGLKAYRDDKGKITLFRPDMNMKRMNTSAARIALPVRVKPEDRMQMGSFSFFEYSLVFSYRLSAVTHYVNSSKNLFDSTSIGFPKSLGTVSTFGQLSVSNQAGAHIWCCWTNDWRSRYPTRGRRAPTKRSAPLCYLQPCRTVLFVWIQACGIRRHNQVCPRRTRRYGDLLTAERSFGRSVMGAY
jgi:hypothetical protein